MHKDIYFLISSISIPKENLKHILNTGEKENKNLLLLIFIFSERLKILFLIKSKIELCEKLDNYFNKNVRI